MRIITIFLLIFMIVSACQSSGDRSNYQLIYSSNAEQSSNHKNHTKQYKIGIVPKITGINYFKAIRDGAWEAAKELGVEVIYRGPSVADSNEQIKVIRSLIMEEVDLIAVAANDPVKVLPVLKEAADQNIKVITWDADSLPEGREFFINAVDPEMLGRHLMDTLASNTNEKGKFAVMTGVLTVSNLNEWLKWIKVQKEEYYPNMELVEVVATNDNSEIAYMKAKHLLNNYPDLAGIIGNSSVAPPAAAQLVKEAGKRGQIKVVGLSTPNLMRSYLHDGYAEVITLWSPKRLGYLTVVLAKNLLDGTLPYDGQEVYNVGNIRVKGDTVIMGEALDFTKENVDQYEF